MRTIGVMCFGGAIITSHLASAGVGHLAASRKLFLGIGAGALAGALASALAGAFTGHWNFKCPLLLHT